MVAVVLTAEAVAISMKGRLVLVLSCDSLAGRLRRRWGFVTFG
jgi:hypothetical protein